MIAEIEGHLQEVQKAEQLQAVDQIDQMMSVSVPQVAEPIGTEKQSVLQLLKQAQLKTPDKQSPAPDKLKDECL